MTEGESFYWEYPWQITLQPTVPGDGSKTSQAHIWNWTQGRGKQTCMEGVAEESSGALGPFTVSNHSMELSEPWPGHYTALLQSPLGWPLSFRFPAHKLGDTHSISLLWELSEAMSAMTRQPKVHKKIIVIDCYSSFIGQKRNIFLSSSTWYSCFELSGYPAFCRPFPSSQLSREQWETER